MIDGICKRFVVYKCEYCISNSAEKCPRSEEVDRFGDPIRLFAVECDNYKPHVDKNVIRETSSYIY